ncbi:MAG: EboA domain-containing protein [Flavobacteriaceae bacterium]
MLYQFSSKDLFNILKQNLDASENHWYVDKLDSILKEKSVRTLYLMYSLCSSKLSTKALNVPKGTMPDLANYLNIHNANVLELGRIHLLVKVLEEDKEFFTEKVSNLIQIADIGELETFLKFLVLLPHSGDYQFSAVEALRTNITTIFDAISLNNPYPAMFFNEQQWNQMYLKAAFLQRDLSSILDIDKRANKNLVRIISDYAHERWAASREIDPEIWRPVSRFLNETLLQDIVKLFESENLYENRAAALCCYYANFKDAKAILEKYPDVKNQVENGLLTWDNLKK